MLLQRPVDFEPAHKKQNQPAYYWDKPQNYPSLPISTKPFNVGFVGGALNMPFGQLVMDFSIFS